MVHSQVPFFAQEADVRPKHERIDCTCPVTKDTPGAEDYAGLWVECDECQAWLHGHCVGLTRPPKGETTQLRHPVPRQVKDYERQRLTL